MRGFRAILVAIIGMTTFMNVAPAATRADLAASRGTQSRSTTAARATINQNTTKSATPATKTAQRNIARTIASRGSNTSARSAGQPAIEARTVATRSAFMVPMAQTGVKSRAATTPKSGTTRRSASGGMVLGRAGTINTEFGVTGSGSISDSIIHVEIPKDLRTLPRMAAYLGLFGENNTKLPFNKNHMPVLKTFFDKMGITSITDAKDKVLVNSEGQVISGAFDGAEEPFVVKYASKQISSDQMRCEEFEGMGTDLCPNGAGEENRCIGTGCRCDVECWFHNEDGVYKCDCSEPAKVSEAGLKSVTLDKFKDLPLHLYSYYVVDRQVVVIIGQDDEGQCYAFGAVGGNLYGEGLANDCITSDDEENMQKLMLRLKDDGE